MIECLLVGIGGFIGSIFRYLIGLIPLKTENVFPIKTLGINVIGAFIIGIIVSVAIKNKNIDSRIVLMLKTGLCGGFTTFSTFAYETMDLMQSGHAMLAIIYVVASSVLGIAAVFMAQMLVQG